MRIVLVAVSLIALWTAVWIVAHGLAGMKKARDAWQAGHGLLKSTQRKPL